MKGVRLQKVIAQAGLASRRAAEAMIREGRVAVNGRVVTEMGVRVDLSKDRVSVDDRPLFLSSKKIVVLFNKPRNCVTTARDPQGRKTVFDFLPDFGVRLFPVGRLDYDAEGLLLFTNDGDLAYRLQHPRYQVAKTYQVKVKGHPDEATLQKLRSGVLLDEGRTAPAEVELIRVLTKAAWLKVVLHQGWYRQLKRMGEAVGHPVLKIRRVGYANFSLGRIQPGHFRLPKHRELKQLYKLLGN